MILAAKYHSYGNDFLIVPVNEINPEDYAELAKQICHPHSGIGADGCVYLEESGEEEFKLRIFNRDGSEAGISGNGARCASAFLHHQGRVSQAEVRLQTQSGLKVFTLLEASQSCWKYRSLMGTPDFVPEAIPMRAPSDWQAIEDHPLQVGDEQVWIHALSVGNPQCVVFVEELPRDPDFERLGRGLETHPDFPERTNVSFARVEGPDRLRIRIWERGVGPTCSSGTGSCGAAVAAIRAGKAQSPVQVYTETGDQRVEWSPDSEIVLTGEAALIGEIKFHWSRSD